MVMSVSGNWVKLNDTDSMRVENLKYQSSWDKLMPVVEKIESLGHQSCIENIGTEHRVYFTHDSVGVRDESKLMTTYKAVLQFIEWYNSKNQTNEC